MLKCSYRSSSWTFPTPTILRNWKDLNTFLAATTLAGAQKDGSSWKWFSERKTSALYCNCPCLPFPSMVCSSLGFSCLVGCLLPCLPACYLPRVQSARFLAGFLAETGLGPVRMKSWIEIGLWHVNPVQPEPLRNRPAKRQQNGSRSRH